MRAAVIITTITAATALSLTISATSAFAEPIVITQGRLGESVSSDLDFFSFGTLSFQLSGSAVGDNIGQCSPCAAGTSYSLSGEWEVPDFIEVNGTLTPAQAHFTFESSSVVVPALQPDQQQAFRRAFDFVGRVTVNSVTTLDLVGRGVASVFFINDVERGTLARTIFYDFGAVQPVPEPATMLLVGAGMAATAALRRRKRRVVIPE